ncbi:14786_t:CDS:2 [Funneliformis geosporum]|nr:14786_t:CDS:2 [Funneliformis geosporum]
MKAELLRKDTVDTNSTPNDHSNEGLEKRLGQIEAYLIKLAKKDTRDVKTFQQSYEIISDWLEDNSDDISIVSFFTSKFSPTISDKSIEIRIDLDPDAFFFCLSYGWFK